MSTLPPNPSYNANIPIVTSSGGTSASYKDPNSPESIMKKATLVQAQAAVDTKYDVDQKEEGFRMRMLKGRGSNNKNWMIFNIVLLLIVIFSSGKKLKPYGKVFLALLAGILVIITIILEQNGGSLGSPGSKSDNTQ
jgi:hypothetical protein